MEMVHGHMKKFAYLGLYIIGLLIVNSILFTHQHSLADGQIVVHAHPFNQTDNPPAEHHHNKNDLQILQNISLLFFTGALVLGFIAKLAPKENHDALPIAYHQTLAICDFGRAPPKQFL